MNGIRTHDGTRVRTIFDSWRSITISLYMVLVGYGVLVGIPVISTAWVTLLGFSEVEVGRVAGADLGGLAIGAFIAAALIAHVNRRLLVVAAVALAIAANVLCLYLVNYEQVLWLRLAAGIGSGVYTAIAVASLGATSNPARSFNLMLFAFAFSQAGELLILPKLSMNGIYWAFIICYAFGLLFIRWLPARPAGKVDSDIEHASIQQIQIPRFVPWMVLGAVLMTYINIGAYWTYIELASLDSDATPSWVSKVLVYTSFFSVLGCLFATVISKRFGLARPLLITLIIQGAVVLMLANGINDRNIIVSLFSFNFLWIFIDVYQMATVANVDPAGRYSALLPGAQGLGQIIGPNLAASILAAGFGYGGVFVMCAAASAVAMLIYLAMYLKLKRVSPELADAS